MTTANTSAPAGANDVAHPRDERGRALKAAWDAVTGMEDHITLVRALLRSLNLMVTADDVIDDERNGEAVLHTIWTAEDALKRAEESRRTAFGALHPMLFGEVAR